MMFRNATNEQTPAFVNLGANANATAFTAWIQERCWAQARFGEPIDKVRPLRTSSDSVTLWQASATTSFAAADRSDPDVAQALALGFDVVRRDAIGVTTRTELGDQVFVLRMHHAPGGRGKKQLGVVLHVGRTFFVYLLSSARASNLDAANEDRRGNAATELLATVVRGMTTAGRALDPGYRPHVHAREHARIVRDEQHGADLKATFVSCRVIAHTPHTSDLTKPSDAQHFSFGSMLSAASADANILGMNRAEIVIQANGGYNGDIRGVPFTHGPMVRIEIDHRTGVEVKTSDKHRLDCTADLDTARVTLRRLVDKILEDRYDHKRAEEATDWAAVGNLMAELDLPSRMPTYLKRNIRLRDLPVGAREAAAKSLFDEPWISGWRDGSFERLVPVKIAMELDLSNLDVEEKVLPNGRSAYPCRIQMPIPTGGWGVSDEEWDLVLRRRHPRGDRPRVYTGNVLPMAGAPEWAYPVGTGADGHQFDITTDDRRYVLRSRPLTQARNRDGSPRGWDGCTVTLLGSARASKWHQDLARAMREALLSLEVAPEPVVLTPLRPLGGDSTPITTTVVGARLAELGVELELAESQRRGAADRANEARGQHQQQNDADSAEDLEEAEDDLKRAKDRVKRARAEKAALEAGEHDSPRPVSPTSQDVGVRTATAEFVAAALEKCDGGAPGWLQEACQQFFADLRMEPLQVTGERPKFRWTATLRLTTVDANGNAEIVGLPLAGEVFARKNARAGNPVQSGPENWAWSFFYRGLDFGPIGTAADIDGSGKKNSFLYKGLSEWLAAADPAVCPNPQLRAAALDCPVPATRRVLWAASTGDVSALRDIDEGFAKHIRTVYGSSDSLPRWSWCRDTHQLARKVGEELLASGGDAPLFQLAASLNVSTSALTALVRENGKPIKPEGATHAARPAMSPFTKNYARSMRWAPQQRAFALRPCPHHDCPKRLRGGTPYASHVLLVPETEAGHGVLCPDCRRLPVKELADIRFPVDYLRPWSGRFGYGSHAGARNHSGSHIDPAFPDPGAAVPLPETGTLPRRETVVNKPGNYLAKHLRERPLGGRRVLTLDLNPKAHDFVVSELERLGGLLAKKVTGGLEYVVVADETGFSAPRAVRAARLGSEIMTFSDFKANARADWKRLDRKEAV